MLKKLFLIIGLICLTCTASAGQAPDTDQGYLPIIRVAPRFPMRAIENKIGGYVILSFTVDTKGRTKNIKVKESSHKMFERNSIKAALKYRYQPKTVNGIPEEVHGVTVKVEFAFAN